MEKLKGEQKCPKCQTKTRNIRDFIGVWECPRCHARWTGGAWESETTRGKESIRIANRLALKESEQEIKK
jgi:ribosomal protein L37AE/L43A